MVKGKKIVPTGEEAALKFRRDVKNLQNKYSTIPPPLPEHLKSFSSKIKSKPSGHGGKKTKGTADSSLKSIDTSKMLFNKLDFDDDKKGNTVTGKRSLLPKDPKVALEKVQAKRQKLDRLRSTDPEAASSFEKKDAWSKAISKAQGITVRDNPRLLKKTLNRKEKKKEKSKKSWEERKESIKEEKQEKQEKRAKNIQARRDANKAKKGKGRK